MNVYVVGPEYLSSPCPDLWRSAEKGEVFLWSDNDSTAAFAKQVSEICEGLTKQGLGLPSFTAVLMIVSMMTTTWEPAQTADRVRRLQRSADSDREESDSEKKIVQWLIDLGSLPKDLKSGVSQQVAFLAERLRACSNRHFEVSGVESADAIYWLNLSPDDRPFTALEKKPFSARCRRAIELLVEFAKHPIQAEPLRLELKTGLSMVPEKVDAITDLTTVPRTIQDLLKSLCMDSELSGLMGMSLNAAATLALPRKPSDPDLLPTGGVSDIVNKGSPERLLSTELAADPMLLLARIATGQALYLRRETPPTSTPQRRPVLIELGIRTWGITRVRAAALALAVACSEERRNGKELDFFTVAGDRSWSEDFSKREGIIQHLSRLEPDIHPGAAIAKLATKWAEQPKSIAEPMLIVTQSTDRDIDYRQSIRSMPLPHLVAIIDRDGNMKLIRRSAVGDEVLQRFKLLYPEEQKALGLAPKPQQPLYLSLPTPPLRTSIDVNRQWAVPGSGGRLWALTANRRIVSFEKSGLGATEHASAVPAGRIVAYAATESGLRMIFVGNEKHFFQVSLDGKTTHAKLESSVASDFGFSGDALFEHGEFVRRIDVLSGKEIARSPRRGKFVGPGLEATEDGSVWIANDFGVEFEWTQWKALRPPVRVGVCAQDRKGEAIAISSDFASFVFALDPDSRARTTGTKVASTGPMRLVMQNEDASKAVIELTHVLHSNLPIRNRTILWVELSLEDGKMREVPRDFAAAAAEIDIRYKNFARTSTIRTRLAGIGCDGQRIVLTKGTMSRLAIEIAEFPHRLRITAAPASSNAAGISNFEEPFRPTIGAFVADWKLQHAELKGGDAWLDSRGLLHLRKRSDGTEVTLVLHDDHMAGWSSLYSSFGPAYFLREGKDVPLPDSMAAWFRDFVEQSSKWQ